jgi:phosphoribosylformylglycinamidine synthase
MKTAVIVFPGSNCDRDVQVALRQSMGSEPCMIWHGDSSLPKVDLIVVPGGFSYGDYLRSGAMAAQSRVMHDVVAKAKKGVTVLGICNGFQILTECGLLPGVLMRNANLRFICKDVYLRTEVKNTVFTSNYDQGQVIRIPIAHHDGNYFAEKHTIQRLKDKNCIAFRYVDADGKQEVGSNPNGSCDNIAGVLNENHNVLGMMPHPERLSDPALGGNQGRLIFDSLVKGLG